MPSLPPKISQSSELVHMLPDKARWTFKDIDVGKLPGWAQFNHKNPYKKKAGRSKRGESNVRTKTETGAMWSCSKECQQSLALGEGKE